MSSVTVDYEFMNEQGQIVKRGTLPTASDIAQYDRASVGAATMLVSEPVTSYFPVPCGVSRVRFRSLDPYVAIIGFTRPRGLPRTFRVPEELGLFERQEEVSRTWYMFRPIGYQQRVAENRVADLAIQTRPFLPHEPLISGQYDWEDHRPREFTPGRFVLTKRDASFSLREEAIPSAYCRVPLDRSVNFTWRTDDPSVSCEPRLMYVTSAGRPGRVRLFVDNTLYHEFVPRANRGEVSLPAVPYSTQLHTLRIVAPSQTTIFLRNVSVLKVPEYIKRFVYELDELLTFDVVKHSDAAEQLVLRAFVPQSNYDRHGGLSGESADEFSRYRLRVRILDIEQRRAGPSSGWTLEQREYDLAPSRDERAILFGGAEAWVDQGTPCAFMLDEDLPPGKYRVEVRCVAPSQPQPFVSLYRVRTPDPSKREVRVYRPLNAAAPQQPTSLQ